MPMIVRFVTAVGADGTGGTLRLDLSPTTDPFDGTRVQLGDRYAFPLPVLRTIAADTGRPLDSDYVDTRRVELEIHVGSYQVATTADVRRAALEALATELDRDTNVLYVLADGATEGRWLVTYQAADVAADLRLDSGWATYPVVLTADAFAYGPLVADSGTTWLRHDGSSAAGFGTASGEPASSEGTAGQWYKTTTAPAKGDVPAHASLGISTTSGSVVGPLLFATREVRYDAHNALRFYQDKSGAGTPGGIGASSLLYSPADTLEHPVTTLTLPDVVAAVSSLRQLLGRWRIFLRVRKTSADDVFLLRCFFGNSVIGPLMTPTPVPVGNGANWQWLDMGVLQLPPGDDRLTAPGPYGDPYGSAEPGCTVYATWPGGPGGNLLADGAIAVPADYSTLIVEAGDYPNSWAVTSTGRLLIDSDRDIVYPVENWAGTPYHAGARQPPPSRGGPLLLSVTYPTQLFVMTDYSGSTVLRTLSVDVSYRPRYLSVV